MTRAWPACQMRPRLYRDGNQTRPKQTNKTHTDRDTELLSARVSHGLNQKKKESLSRSDRLTHTRNPVLSCCKGSRSRRGQENHGPSPANLTRCSLQAPGYLHLAALWNYPHRLRVRRDSYGPPKIPRNRATVTQTGSRPRGISESEYKSRPGISWPSPHPRVAASSDQPGTARSSRDRFGCVTRVQ